MPDRDGHHVILAYWEVADTPSAFYQAIDANFDGEFVEPSDGDGNGGNDNDNGNEIASCDPSKVYLKGDIVSHDGKVYEAQ